jgi:hypothetical protein
MPVVLGEVDVLKSLLLLLVQMQAKVLDSMYVVVVQIKI